MLGNDFVDMRDRPLRRCGRTQGSVEHHAGVGITLLALWKAKETAHHPD